MLRGWDQRKNVCRVSDYYVDEVSGDFYRLLLAGTSRKSRQQSTAILYTTESSPNLVRFRPI